MQVRSIVFDLHLDNRGISLLNDEHHTLTKIQQLGIRHQFDSNHLRQIQSPKQTDKCRFFCKPTIMR